MLYDLTVSSEVDKKKEKIELIDLDANLSFSEGLATCLCFNTCILKMVIIISTRSISMWRNTWENTRQNKTWWNSPVLQ